MKAAYALALMVALAGCDRQPTAPRADARGSTAQVSTTVARQSTLAPTGQGLTAQISSLSASRSDFQVQVTDTATIVALAADTLFAFDKADLAPDAVANLGKTADLVRAGSDAEVGVTGYTDAKGSDAYNRDLSRRRAEAVVAWLRTQPGLATRRFAAVGSGAADPVAPNTHPDGSDDPEGRARNRRVVVTIGKRQAN